MPSKLVSVGNLRWISIQLQLAQFKLQRGTHSQPGRQLFQRRRSSLDRSRRVANSGEPNFKGDQTDGERHYGCSPTYSLDRSSIQWSPTGIFQNPSHASILLRTFAASKRLVWTDWRCA